MLEPPTIIFTFLLMILIQIFHIFEEIGCRVYVIMGALKKYLFAASGIVTLNFAFYALILLDLRIGYILGIFGAVTAIANGIVHLVGYLKTKPYYETVGAGVFTGIPLGIIGGIVLWQLIQIL